jgi:hypothetical protein
MLRDAPVQKALRRVHAAANSILDCGSEGGYEEFKLLATAQRLDGMRAREAAELQQEVAAYRGDFEMDELYQALSGFLLAHRIRLDW